MLAPIPPLGWNSWNTFGEHISDALIREMADFMAENLKPRLKSAPDGGIL